MTARVLNNLRPAQIADLAYMIARPRGGLLHDPSVGKTPPVCVFLYYLHSHLKQRSVWIMPKSLIGKNVSELLRFTPFEIEDVKVVDSDEALVGGAVFLMTPERWKMTWKSMGEIGAVVVDEWHMAYKTVDSQRFQALEQSMRKIERLWAMTGSLIAGKLSTCYPFIHLIEPRYYGSIYQFENYHGVRNLDGKITHWHRHEKVAEIFRRHCIRRTFEMEYGEKAVVVIPELIDMGPQMRKAYSEWHDKALLELEDRFLTAPNKGVAAIRARQILAHPETFGLCKNEPTGKDERLAVRLADSKNNGQKFIIFAALVPEQQRLFDLVKREGFRVALINGSVSGDKRSTIDKAFQEGALDGIVCSQECAAVGFNWGMADWMSFESLDYQDTNVNQGIMRGIRGKRDKPLRVYIPQYRQSIEWRIIDIIETKSQDAHAVDETQKVLKLHAYDKDVDALVPLNLVA